MKELILCALMVKDEAPRIERTLNSVKDHINLFVFLDTGSNDDTISVIRKWCSENNKTYYMHEKPFEDFSKSRNYLLSKCYSLSTFILLLDSNDECNNTDELIKFCKLQKNNREVKAYQTTHYWINDTFEGDSKFFPRISMVRNCKDVEYRYPIHECIFVLNGLDSLELCNNTKFFIFQNRMLDKSSFERQKKDIDILFQEYEKDRYDLRIIAYIVKYAVMFKEYKLAEKFSIIMNDIAKQYKQENERTEALTTLGIIRWNLKKNWEEPFLTILQSNPVNLNAIFALASYYYQDKQLEKAKKYIDMCCELESPKSFPIGSIISTTLINKSRYVLKNFIYQELSLTDSSANSNEKSNSNVTEKDIIIEI